MESSPSLSLVGRTINFWESSESIPPFDSVLAMLADATEQERAAAVLVDQRMRWERDAPIHAEEYLRRCPDIAADPELRLDVVYGELHLLGGTAARLAEFEKRFPDLRESLERQMLVRGWLDADEQPAETIDERHDSSLRSVPPPAFDPAPLSFDDFELLECLGSGAMGEVHRALQKSLHKPVALKILKPRRDLPPETIERFFREARATASLRHPNIIDVHGVGRCPAGGGYFLVMDLIDGHTLQDEIAQEPLSCEQAARAAADVAAALQHAHERGLIHRDVKPSNVLRHRDGRIVLADFGLSKLLTEGEQQLSVDGSVIGTPPYMAPEQIEAARGPIGPATDVYGLGALLYALLTGRPPVEGKTVVGAIAEVLSHHHVKHPSVWRSGIPKEMEQICLDCLQKDPARRPATAEEVRRRLVAWSGGHAAAGADIASQRTKRQAMRPSVQLALAGMLVLGLVGIVWQRVRGVGQSEFSSVGDLPASRSDSVAKIEATKNTTPVRWRVVSIRGLSSTEPAIVDGPVVNDDRLRIEVALGSPRFVYAYWIGSDGSIRWLDREGPPAEPLERFSLPAQAGTFFPIEGDAGTEVCLVLLRDEPLADPARLAAALTPDAPLPPLLWPMPVADGDAVLPENLPADAPLLGLAGPDRNVGRAESLLGTDADRAMSAWQKTWPADAGQFHYLAIPHIDADASRSE